MKGYCSKCYKTLFDVLHDVFVLFTPQQNTRATCEPFEMCTDILKDIALSLFTYVHINV